MATEKTVVVNYTPEQTAQMISDYTAGVSVEKIAETLGKTVRSVTMKLVREKVYIKKEYKTKSGASVVKKDSLIDKVSEYLGLTENEATSFEHVNKTALVKLLAKFE